MSFHWTSLQSSWNLCPRDHFLESCAGAEAPIAKEESKWSTKRLDNLEVVCSFEFLMREVNRVLPQEGDGGELDEPQQGEEASMG